MTSLDPMAAPLSCEGVHARYGRRRVLHGVDLAVARGSTVGLIGLNGAGKTTLIKTILALRPAEAGTIRLFGRDGHRPDARRDLAFLPEQYAPAPGLRGWTVLDLACRAFGLRLDRDEAAARAVALDLDPEVLSRRVATLSKGMGQKLGLLATLLVERPLILLDEPMSGLDPRARHALKRALEARRAAGGATLFSSHILSDVAALCDRVVAIHAGRVIAEGPPQALIDAAGTGDLESAFLAAVTAAEADAPAA
ncbi:MAG: ABC transporter ATP-binding protein [Azospirillaceae bacterium]